MPFRYSGHPGKDVCTEVSHPEDFPRDRAVYLCLHLAESVSSLSCTCPHQQHQFTMYKRCSFPEKRHKGCISSSVGEDSQRCVFLSVVSFSRVLGEGFSQAQRLRRPGATDVFAEDSL